MVLLQIVLVTGQMHSCFTLLLLAFAFSLDLVFLPYFFSIKKYLVVVVRLQVKYMTKFHLCHSCVQQVTLGATNSSRKVKRSYSSVDLLSVLHVQLAR